jgi:RNA polymerase sigma-70 factor (ECF subfamily)
MSVDYRDPANFAELVEHHHDKIIMLIFRFVNDRDDAHDLAQDVFISAYDKLNHFRGEAQIATWLHRIAVNKALDFLRKRKRQQRREIFKQWTGQTNESEDIADLGRGDPLIDIVSEEQSKLLQWALEKLTTKQRTAIILHKYEGHSYKEIATIMGTSLSAVESLIHKGIKHLRERLANKLKGYYYE